jgi:hypothetical protein
MLSQSEIQELMEMGIDPSSVYINNQYQLGGAVEDKYCPPGFTYDSTNDVCINDATGMADMMVQPIVSKPEAPQPKVEGGEADVIGGIDYAATGAPMSSDNRTTVASPPPPPAAAPATTPAKKGMFGKVGDFLVKNKGIADAVQKTTKGAIGLMDYAQRLSGTANQQQSNANMAQQSIFSKPKSNSYYNYDFVNENDPLHALAEDGLAVRDITKGGNVPIEAEGGEFYLDNKTGATIPIKGPSHEQGGVQINAKDGSYILSDNVKIPGSLINSIIGVPKEKANKNFTIADVIRKYPKQFDTKADSEALESPNIDFIRRNSHQINLQKKLANLSKILAYQQEVNGNYGEEQEMEGMEEMEGSEMRRGGLIASDGAKAAAERALKLKPYTDAVEKSTQEQTRSFNEWLNDRATKNPGALEYVPNDPKFGPYAGLKYELKLDNARYTKNINPSYAISHYGLPAATPDGKSISYVMPYRSMPYRALQEGNLTNQATAYGSVNIGADSEDMKDFYRRHPWAKDPKFDVSTPDGVKALATEMDARMKAAGGKGFVITKKADGTYDGKFGEEMWSVPAITDIPPDTTNIPDRYSCKDGNCGKDPNGPYSSLEECNKNCSTSTVTTKYSCIDGQCNPDANGTYSSMEACQTECSPGKTKRRTGIDLSGMFGMLQGPPTTNYAASFQAEQMDPRLVSYRSAKNDAAATQAALLQALPTDPATSFGRAASVYGDYMKQMGQITEAENNQNAQILNQADQFNIQSRAQANQMQQQANQMLSQANAQDAAARDTQAQVNYNQGLKNRALEQQYFNTLDFADKTMLKDFTPVYENGVVVGFQKNTPTTFGRTANIQSTANTYSGTLSSDDNDANDPNKKSTTTKKKFGGKNQLKKRKLIY